MLHTDVFIAPSIGMTPDISAHQRRRQVLKYSVPFEFRLLVFLLKAHDNSSFERR